MFLENASRKGWIEVICGSMFSGKTEELIRRLKRAKLAHQRVEIFKPRIDVRYSEEEVVSHDANAIRSTPVESPQNILLMTSDVDVVGIDEAQFFDDSIVDVCRQLANNGVRVIVAGLDRKTLRPDAGADGHGRVRHQGARHLRALRQPRPPFAPSHQRREAGDAGRPGLLRSDLPPLLQQTDRKTVAAVGRRPLAETPYAENFLKIFKSSGDKKQRCKKVKSKR